MERKGSKKQFCSRNKLLCNIFYQWYKDTRSKLVEVKVDGLLSPGSRKAKEERHPQEASSTEAKTFSVRILVELRMSHGLHITQRNVSNQEQKALIEKWEGLSQESSFLLPT